MTKSEKLYSVTNDIENQLVNDPVIAYRKNSDLKDSLQNDMYMMKLSRKGLSFSRFEKMTASFDISLADWAQLLDIPLRTLYRYRTEDRKFSFHHSEAILRIFSFVLQGIDFFGEGDKFFKWLRTPAFVLDGKAPWELIDSQYGLDFLKDHLHRLEQGIFA